MMTNPRVVVPHIEKLIVLVPREKAAGSIHPEDAKELQKIRNELTSYFERLETEISSLRRDLMALQKT
jgi:hypothetical protein